MRLSEGVDDGRALDHHRRFLVAWKMRHWGLVDTSTGIYVDRIDDFCTWFRVFVCLVLVLVLARGRQEKAAVRGEGEAPEERGQGLVGIQAGILHACANRGRDGVRLGRSLHGHDCWQGHRWCWGD